MCGITGFVGSGDKEVISNMTDTLRHRGPDNKGFILDDNVALGHTRLSVIDTSVHGHQPMWNKAGTAAVVFNGEIYNFQELRDGLIKTKGNVFDSDSDTEIVLALYDIYGEKCFEKFNGMFAIAIYDKKEQKLILARDRMGKKPLYWGVIDNTLIFGSELKALMSHPLFKKDIDIESVNKYLLYEYVPTPYTIFKNIWKLEPATYLIYKNSKIKKSIFWSFNGNSLNISESKACGELEKYIDKSVKSRLISDVPLGIFLSGGLDSSAIAYFAQKNYSEKIKTFSIGFDEQSFDESSYAREVAQFLGTEHYTYKVTSEQVKDIVPNIVDIIDEPLADASIIPTYLLSKFTKERVTVALGGDGGDELFAGYPTFQTDTFIGVYSMMPKWIKYNVIKMLVSLLPVSDKYLGLSFLINKFVGGFDGDNNKYHIHQRWLGSFSYEERKELFKNDIWDSLSDKDCFESVDNLCKDINIPKDNNKLLALYMRTYLMDKVLVKVDRASMSHGLEVRTPLLDYNLVDFVMSLPYRYKYKYFTTKYLLKKLMRDKLPKNIINRKKQGFALPISSWLRGDLRGFCSDVLSEKNIERVGLFNVSVIETLKEEHFNKKKDNGKKLWTLIVFQLWYNKWVK